MSERVERRDQGAKNRAPRRQYARAVKVAAEVPTFSIVSCQPERRSAAATGKDSISARRPALTFSRCWPGLNARVSGGHKATANPLCPGATTVGAEYAAV